MTKLVYLDCPTGIAGDMCLGALVAAGVPLEYLSEKLKGLGIDQEYQLRVESVHRNGQLATKVHVDLLKLAEHHHNGDRDHEHEHTHDHSEAHATDTQHQRLHHHPSVHKPTRHLPEIERLITAAGLPPRVLEWSLAVFRKLAEAEGAVHGIAPEKVHFHEVGATDAIVDIVGTCLGLDWLGIDQLYCSALPTGGGTVKAAHGRLPVPVPAVMKLWESRQVPVYSNGIDRELVTPTGAALVVTLATSFGPPPAMILQQVGNGAGSLQLPIPNILRLWIGEELESHQIGRSESYPKPSHLQHSNLPPSTVQPSNLPPSTFQPSTVQPSNLLETISVLETQIDDLSPQAIGYVFERLFDVGAVDVFTQAIGMKKSRPGILLTVICPPEKIPACEAVLFCETTTLGIRRLTQQRAILQREIQRVRTKYGEIRVKVAWSEGTSFPLRDTAMPLAQPDAQQHSAEGSTHKTMINVQPEYEDCAELAKANNLSWREVHQLALQTWYRHHEQQSDLNSTG